MAAPRPIGLPFPSHAGPLRPQQKSAPHTLLLRITMAIRSGLRDGHAAVGSRRERPPAKSWVRSANAVRKGLMTSSLHRQRYYLRGQSSHRDMAVPCRLVWPIRLQLRRPAHRENEIFGATVASPSGLPSGRNRRVHAASTSHRPGSGQYEWPFRGISRVRPAGAPTVQPPKPAH